MLPLATNPRAKMQDMHGRVRQAVRPQRQRHRHRRGGRRPARLRADLPGGPRGPAPPHRRPGGQHDHGLPVDVGLDRRGGPAAALAGLTAAVRRGRRTAGSAASTGTRPRLRSTSPWVGSRTSAVRAADSRGQPATRPGVRVSPTVGSSVMSPAAVIPTPVPEPTPRPTPGPPPPEPMPTPGPPEPIPPTPTPDEPVPGPEPTPLPEPGPAPGS